MEEVINNSVRTVVVSVNPNSGSSDRTQVVEELCHELETLGFSVIVLRDIDEVKQKVLELNGESACSQLATVVAAGGDGTVALLANRLPPQTPLAILPLGTENLLAKYIGLSADPKSIARMVADGRTTFIDAGKANGQMFFVMASCGFDADVVHRLHSQRKGHIRHWSYARPIVEAITSYRYPRIRIYVDERDSPVVGKWAFVFNVPRYAMNLPIVPGADPSDGRLDLCTFRGGRFFRGMFYLLTILLNRHRQWNYSRVERFKKIRIESDESVPFQLDGDPGGNLPLEIEIVPRFLQVFVPESYAAELPCP
ncbi:MAG: diacylglycerol/lipid kinase family protein [Mariniblastus sp.]